MKYEVMIVGPNDKFNRDTIYAFRHSNNEALRSKAKFNNGLAFDEFDRIAIHVVLLIDGEIKTCVRALPSDCVDSPMNHMVEGFDKDLAKYIPPDAKYCMITSFLIAQEYQKNIHVRSLLLHTLYKHLHSLGYEFEILTATKKLAGHYKANYKGVTLYQKPYVCKSIICPSPGELHYIVTRRIDPEHHPLPPFARKSYDTNSNVFWETSKDLGTQATPTITFSSHNARAKL